MSISMVLMVSVVSMVSMISMIMANARSPAVPVLGLHLPRGRS